METIDYYSKPKSDKYAVYMRTSEYGKSHSSLIGTYSTPAEADAIKNIYQGNPPSCKCGGIFYWYDNNIDGSPLYKCDTCGCDVGK